MKIKIFRKILAVMIVASTVMAMPGSSLACPDGVGDGNPEKLFTSHKRQRGEENSEDEDYEDELFGDSEGGKRLKTGENQYVKFGKNKKQNENEPQKQGQSFNLDDEISKLNSLLKKFPQKEDEKNQIKNVFENLMKHYLQGGCCVSEVVKLIKAIVDCLDNQAAKLEIARVIAVIALNGLLSEYSAKPIDGIVYTLCRAAAGSGGGAL